MKQEAGKDGIMIRLLQESIYPRLPALEGTEKQVSWAGSIRRDWMHDADLTLASMYMRMMRGYRRISPDDPKFKGWAKAVYNLACLSLAIRAVLKSAVSAGWWIDRKDDSILTDSGRFIPMDGAGKTREADLDIGASVILATGNATGGEDLGSSILPSAGDYIKPAQDFAEWVLATRDPASVTYEDALKFLG